MAAAGNGDKGRSFSASGGFREAVGEELILGGREIEGGGGVQLKQEP